MATVKGPLFSLDAAGQIGKALVYNTWKGRSYVREWVNPTNPNDIAQTLQRGAFAALSTWWDGIADAERATWNALADANRYSPFNAFMAFNLDRETRDLYPLMTPTGFANVVDVTLDDISAVGGKNLITITTGYIDSQSPSDLVLISLGTNGGGAATSQTIRRTLLNVRDGSSSAMKVQTAKNIPAGVYHLTLRACRGNGVVVQSTSTAVAATVTD